MKQGMPDYSGNDGEVTSQSSSRLSASRMPWDVDRGYLD